MIGRTTEIYEPLAPWAARIGLFAGILIAIACLLHRLSAITTPVAINLLGLGFILAALALAIGLYSAVSIWVRGRIGAWPTTCGILLATLIWVWPLALVPTLRSLPHISDITTDTANPPAFLGFKGLKRATGAGANAVAYAGPQTASAQAKAYPDLRTLVVPRPAEEVYEITLNLVSGRRGLGWKVVQEEPPQGRKPGLIQATDRTLILGFTDDIVIRIGGTDQEARVDIRSASRYGAFDFGANVGRIRRFAHELSTRIDQAGPVGVAGRSTIRINRAETRDENLRRPLARKPAKAESRQ